MIAVVQRVTRASVAVSGSAVSEIGRGMVVLVAALSGDTTKEVEWMARRLVTIRIFEDASRKMNLSAAEVGGEFMIVSNFTVASDAKKGRRPSFDKAADYDQAKILFDHLIHNMRAEGAKVQTGVYGAEMTVEIINDGPITIIVETPS